MENKEPKEFKEKSKKEGGWIQLWRKIRDSEIWEQEPWRFKTWIWMILEANHSKITRFGWKLKRGQLYVNRIEDLCKIVRWKKGFVYKMPTVEAMKQFWRWLRKKGMVDTKKTTRGTIITILNYDKYQDIKKGYVDTIVDTNIDTTQTPITPQDRQPLKQLKKYSSIRRRVSFKREDYNLVLKEYQRLKGITLQGQEYRLVEQTIKTMFLSDRTPKQIISCMQWLASLKEDWAKNWTINTVRKKLPEFVAGKFNKAKDSELYAD
jgi:hypothetical protein